MTLPKHWERSNVGQIATILRGVSYPKNSATNIPGENSVLILRGGNIQDGKIVVDADRVYVPNSFIDQSQYLKKGDVIIVASTGSKALIGKAAISLRDEPYIAFGAFLMLLRPSNVVDGAFFGYFFLTDEYRFNIRRLSAGININNIRRDHISGMRIPIPPLPEQKLIAAKLDKLFGHLDRIRERLDKIPALLKQFRQAVLTQAVTGKLTEEWRLQNSAKDWEKKSLEELTIKIGDGLHGTPKYDDNGDYYFINGNNLDDGRIIIKGSTRRINETEYARICNDLGSATILLSINGTLGKVALYNHEKVALGKSIAYFNLNAEEYKHYIRRYFESPHFQRTLVEIATGSTIKNVPLKGLRRHVIRIPPIQEQREIVRRVELLLEIVERIEMHYNALNVKIGQLPQAILSKAFTGELVKAVIKEYEMQLKEIEAIVAKESTPGNES